MEAKTFSSAELDGLISELMDGQLTTDQKVRLAEILRDCPEAQRYYQQLMGQHALLYFDAVPLPSGPVTSTRLDAAAQRDNRDSVEVKNETPHVPPVETRGLGWGSGTTWLLSAGGALIVALIGEVLVLLLNSPRPANRDTSTPVVAAAGRTEGQNDDYVATLVVATQCRWESPGSLQEGGRLLPGPFRLLAGTADIQFDSGPTLKLVGPAFMEIQSKASAKVFQGTVLLRNNLSGDQFTLRTPTSKLLDIGTEFGVVVDSKGEDVHVFEGAVQHISDTPGKSDQIEQLQAGQARHYDKSTESGRSIPLDGMGFSRQNSLPSDSSKPDEPFAFEPFNYPPGNVLERVPDTGQGWKRFWVWDGEPRIVQDPRGFPGREGTSPTRFAEFSRKGALHRWLAEPIHMDRDGIWYFSFLFRRGHERPDPINAFVVVLRNEEEMDDTKSLRIGMMGEDQVLFVTCMDGGARTSFPLAYDTTCLMVGKIVTGQSAHRPRSSSKSSVPTTR